MSAPGRGAARPETSLLGEEEEGEGEEGDGEEGEEDEEPERGGGRAR